MMSESSNGHHQVPPPNNQLVLGNRYLGVLNIVLTWENNFDMKERLEASVINYIY